MKELMRLNIWFKYIMKKPKQTMEMRNEWRKKYAGKDKDRQSEERGLEGNLGKKVELKNHD